MGSVIFKMREVRAALNGRKTQFRRVVKPQPIYGYYFEKDGEWFKHERNADDDMMGWCPDYYNGHKPRYSPGDILWVRETWLDYPPKYYYRATDGDAVSICLGLYLRAYRKTVKLQLAQTSRLSGAFVCSYR